jgi:hypothetical protein
MEGVGNGGECRKRRWTLGLGRRCLGACSEKLGQSMSSRCGSGCPL